MSDDQQLRLSDISSDSGEVTEGRVQSASSSVNTLNIPVPENWENVSIGEIGELDTSSVDKKTDSEETSVQLVNYMDVYERYLINSEIDYMEVTAPESQLKRSQVEPGDILFTPSSEEPGDIGHSAVLTEQMENTLHSYHTVRLRPTFENIPLDTYFSGLVANAPYVMKQFSRRATGSTRYTLTLDDFANTRVLIPPLEEQRKIASILYNIDNSIQKTEEILDQARRLQSGFIRERVTAQNSEAERKEGIVGTRRLTIPKHWSVVRLGDVADIVSGKSFPRKYQEGHAGPRAVIKVEDMNIPGNDKYIEDVTNRVTDEVLDELSKNIFPKDTVIHPRVGEALLLNKIRITSEDAAFDDNIMGWVPDGINPEYLYYASTMIDFNSVAQTGTVPSINKEMAANFRFPLPPKEEQREIVKDLARIDGQISIYDQEKKRLHYLKQGLMQDVLSGDVRTTDADIEVLPEVAQHG